MECTIRSLVVKVYRLIWFNIRTSGRVIELSIERSGFIKGVEFDLLRELLCILLSWLCDII
jgi:hypothetical protein